MPASVVSQCPGKKKQISALRVVLILYSMHVKGSYLSPWVTPISATEDLVVHNPLGFKWPTLKTIQQQIMKGSQGIVRLEITEIPGLGSNDTDQSHLFDVKVKKSGDRNYRKLVKQL